MVARKLSIAALLAACGGPAPVDELPACGDVLDGAWRAGFELPGLSGVDYYGGVNDLVRSPDGRVYAGGLFTDAVGVPARNVAMWDGVEWAALGDGLPGEVTQLALTSAGTLWAAGVPEQFDETGYLARWDGVTWTMIASDLDGRIAELTETDLGLVVGGTFTSIGGVSTQGLARYDGEAWSGFAFDTTDPVWISAIARTAEGFCVAGRINTPTIGGAACWDGLAWSALGEPLPGWPTELAQAPDGTWYVGGDLWFELDDGASFEQGIASLGPDGTWRPLDGGLHPPGFVCSAYVTDFGFRGDELIVAGGFDAAGDPPVSSNGLAGWSPSRGWRNLSAGIRGSAGEECGTTVHALAIDDASGTLWIGGQFGAGPTPVIGIARIDAEGRLGSVVPDRELLGTWGEAQLVVRGGDVILPNASFAGDLGFPELPVFDGRGWRTLPDRPDAETIADLVVRSDDTLVISTESDLPSLQTWDGQTWTSQPTARPLSNLVESPTGLLHGVSWATSCSPDSGYPCLALERWDGRELHTIGTFDGYLTAYVWHDGSLFAGGSLASVDDVAVEALAVRTQGRWRALDLAGGVTALASSPLGLVIAGNLGPASRAQVAIWTEEGGLRTLGELTHDREYEYPQINAMAACRGGIVVGGRFDSIDGVPARNLAWFDGELWHSLGAGRPDEVVSLAITEGHLYVGSAGRAASGLAIWDLPPE